jgi:predicted nuclease of predicted toxin-antitoxin system
MTQITLLLDEDVRPLLAEILRQRGYDAVHVLEVSRGGKSDLEQLAYAVSQGRAMLTHNIRDYLLLDGNTEHREKSITVLSSPIKFLCERFCAERSAV